MLNPLLSVYYELCRISASSLCHLQSTLQILLCLLYVSFAQKIFSGSPLPINKFPGLYLNIRIPLPYCHSILSPEFVWCLSSCLPSSSPPKIYRIHSACSSPLGYNEAVSYFKQSYPFVWNSLSPTYCPDPTSLPNSPRDTNFPCTGVDDT